MNITKEQSHERNACHSIRSICVPWKIRENSKWKHFCILYVKSDK